MSPTSFSTRDARTLRRMIEHDEAWWSPGQWVERWLGTFAMAVISLALLSVLVL